MRLLLMIALAVLPALGNPTEEAFAQVPIFERGQGSRTDRTDFAARWDTLWTFGGTGDTLLASAGYLVPDDRGGVFVMDYLLPKVHHVDADGTLRWSWGTKGRGPGEWSDGRAMALDVNGGVVLVDYGNRRIVNLSYDGDLIGEVGYDIRSLVVFGVAVLQSGLYVMHTEAPVPWILVDRDGKAVDSTSVELPSGFGDLSLYQRGGLVARWKEDRWVFGFEVGNGWFTFRREAVDLASPYVEHTDFPPRDGPGAGDLAVSAVSLSVRGDTLAVLFGGNTRARLYWLDLYDLNSGAYLKSLFLPMPAKYAVMGPEGQVFLVTYDLYPTVMAIRPRNLDVNRNDKELAK